MKAPIRKKKGDYRKRVVVDNVVTDNNNNDDDDDDDDDDVGHDASDPAVQRFCQKVVLNMRKLELVVQILLRSAPFCPNHVPTSGIVPI